MPSASDVTSALSHVAQAHPTKSDAETLNHFLDALGVPFGIQAVRSRNVGSLMNLIPPHAELALLELQ